MLKSNIIVRIVWFTVVVSWLQSWNLLNDPRTIESHLQCQVMMSITVQNKQELFTFMISSRNCGEHVSMPTDSCSNFIRALQQHTNYNKTLHDQKHVTSLIRTVMVSENWNQNLGIFNRSSIAKTKSNQIKSNLFAQIYHINIGSSKSVHEQGQQGWKQH